MMNRKATAAFAIILFPLLMWGQKPRIVKWQDMERLLAGGDSVCLVNFWATWCKPCVAELPYFQALADQMQGKKIRMVLVSLDSPADFKKRVLPLLKKKGIRIETWLLDEAKQHIWMDKVSPEWSGSIPMTLLIGPGKSVYTITEHEFHSQDEILKHIQTFIPGL